MSREDCAPGAIIAVFINCFVDGSRRRRRLGVMGVYAAVVHSLRFSGAGFAKNVGREMAGLAREVFVLLLARSLSLPRMRAEGLILTTRSLDDQILGGCCV